MKMSDIARGYCDSMLRGVIPPHNWDRNVSKTEKRKIYDAYVEYYIGLVKGGKKLPKRWPCKGLTEHQRQKIYDARGFGSTDRLNGFAGAKKVLLREEKKREADEYWKCHGGYRTKEVMEIAKEARRNRDEFRKNRSILKMIRRGVAKNLIDVNESRTVPGRYETRWYFFTYCEQRRKVAEERSAKAAFKCKIEEAFEYVKRNDRVNWIVEYTEEVGLSNAHNYTVLSLPHWYDSKFFDNYRRAIVGRSLAHAIFFEFELLRANCREELSRSIKSNKGASSESFRQLRALGFVA